MADEVTATTVTEPAAETAAPVAAEPAAAPASPEAEAVAAIEAVLKGDAAPETDGGDAGDADQTPAAAPAAAPAEPTAVPDDLLASARRAGIPSAAARAMGEEYLRMTLAALGVEGGGGPTGPSSAPQTVATTQAPATAAPAPAPAAAAPVANAPALDLQLDRFEPEIAEAFKKLHSTLMAHVSQQVATLDARVSQFAPLEERVGKFDQYLQQSQQQQLNQWVEQQFASLGDDYRDLIGSGTAEEMDGESPQMKNRRTLLEEVDVLVRGYQSLNKPVPKDVFARAISSAFPSHQQTIARRKVVQGLKRDTNGQFVARPAQRSTLPAAPGTDPGFAAFAAVASKHGIA